MKTIPLTKGYEALVDDVDYENVSRFKWQADIQRRLDGTVRNVYATRRFAAVAGKRRSVFLHRYLLNLRDPMIQCDHIDHDGLNNSRQNLRVADQSQNAQNQRKQFNTRSVWKGVHSHKRGNKRWEARIQIQGHRISIGYFATERDAAKAYNDVAVNAFGEYACLNDCV